MMITEPSGGCGCVDHRVQASPQQLQLVVERIVSFMFVVSVECLVCDSCYVEAKKTQITKTYQERYTGSVK